MPVFVSSSSSPETVNALLILSGAVICAISSGFLYWWSALAPGLQHVLNLSNSQSIALIATANSATGLAFIVGFIHKRLGNRHTNLLGSTGTFFCFAAITLITIIKPRSTLAFPALLIFTVGISVCSYMMYSTAIMVAVSVFPDRLRGRVVGLLSTFLGAAAGICGTFQAAFFPTLNDTTGILLFVSLFPLLASLIGLFLFPISSNFEYLRPMSVDHADYQSITTSNNARYPGSTGKIEPGIEAMYRIAWFIVLSLQCSAAFEAIDSFRSMQIVWALFVALALLSFQLVSWWYATLVRGKHASQETIVNRGPPFSDVVRDVRFVYIGVGFLVLIAGGGLAFLVEAPSIVASRLFDGSDDAAKLDEEKVARVVRSFVTIFSACNVMARLLAGDIMDWGTSAEERVMWTYTLFHACFFVMAGGLLMLAFANFWYLYFGVVLIGLSYGAFLSSSKNLVLSWFGTHGFATNFGFCAIFVTIGAISIGSVIPSWLMNKFGSWSDVATVGGGIKRACSGMSCTAPSFSLLCTFHVAMFAWGFHVQKRAYAVQ